jgi:hypothetical protein
MLHDILPVNNMASKQVEEGPMVHKDRTTINNDVVLKKNCKFFFFLTCIVSNIVTYYKSLICYFVQL